MGHWHLAWRWNEFWSIVVAVLGSVGAGGLSQERRVAVRTLRCAIEQIEDWHPHLFVEPHIVALVAVAARYSDPPARFDVESQGIGSCWLGGSGRCQLEIAWHADNGE